MKKTLIFFILCAGLALYFSSCHPEYKLDKDNLDLTVNVGGDSIALPLGSTKKFTLDSLLSESGVKDLLKPDANGTYVLEPAQVKIAEHMDVIDVESFRIESIKSTQSFQVGMDLSGLLPDVPDLKDVRESAIREAVPVNFDYNDIPDMVVEIDYLDFQGNTYLDFEITFDQGNLPDFLTMDMITPNLKVHFPDVFIFDKNGEETIYDDNSIRVNEFESGRPGYIHKRLHFIGMDFSGIPLEDKDGHKEIHFLDSIIVTGTFSWEEDDIVLPGSLPPSFQPQLDLDAEIVCTILNIEPNHAVGKFDLSIPGQNLEVELGDMPDMLSGDNVRLDFDNPRVDLVLQTNVTIPVDVVLELKPIYNGAVDENTVVRVDLKIEPPVKKGLRTVHYWLARKNTDEKPADAEYVYADLSQLLQRIPQSLKVDVTVNTDQDRRGEYVFGSDIEINATLTPQVPLVFGPDLRISYNDTMSGLNIGGTLATLLKGNRAEIIAEVTNTLPLNIDLNLEAMDSTGAKIDVMGGGKKTIRAAQTSYLDFLLEDPNGLLENTPLRSLGLNFVVKSEESLVNEGRCRVNKDAYFQAKLKVKLPGGFTVDANEFFNE